MSTQHTQPGVFRSLVWKETWQLKEFFLAMLILGAVMQWLVAGWIAGYSAGQGAQAFTYAMALIGGFTALFAAACGATLFATEKEEGTFQNLQVLPLRSGHLAVGKLLGALLLISLFLLLALAIAFGSLQVSGVASANWLTLFNLVFGLGAIEFFAWSWLFSLHTTRPLNAALLGIFCASLGIQLAVLLSGQKMVDFAALEPYAVAWPWRALIAVLVLALASLRSWGWLHQGGAERRAQRSMTPAAGRWGTLAAPVRWVRRIWDRNNEPLWRLTWQSCRQSWKSVGLVMLATPAFAVLLTLLNRELWVVAIPLLMVAGGLAAVVALSADQKLMGARFLATRGIAPFQIWLSRVLPVMLAICLFYAALYAVALLTAPFWYADFSWPNPTGTLIAPTVQDQSTGLAAFFLALAMGLVTAGTLLCFSIGQLVAIVIRSTFLAAIVTMVLCLPAVLWLLLMVVGGVPIWWSVLPIMLAFLLAGGWAMRGLLLEKSLWSKATGPTLLIAIVVATVTLAVIKHRAEQIPAVPVTFSRVDNSDPTVVEAMGRQLRLAAAGLDRPESLPDGLLRWYPMLLKANRLFEDGHASSLKSAFDETLSSNDLLVWDESQRLATAPDLQTLQQLTDAYLDRNAESLGQLRQAIQFAWNHQQQLTQRAPAIGWNLDDRVIPQLMTGIESLQLAFDRALDQGDPQAAWDNLLALLRLYKLRELESPDDGYWLRGLIDQLQAWAVCENQTPESIMNAIGFVLRHFQPIRPERVLERQQLGMLSSIDKGNFAIETRPALKLLSLFSLLPSEQERARRLIQVWTAVQLADIQSQPPIIHANPLFPIPRIGQTNDVPQTRTGSTLTRLLRGQSSRPDDPEWLKSLHKGDFVFWQRTTLLGRLGSSYLRLLDFRQLSEGQLPNHGDLSQLCLEQKELLLLQLFVIHEKLSTGAFPETLDAWSWLSSPKGITHYESGLGIATRRYFYLPAGSKHGVVVVDRWGDRIENLDIPAKVPFIANRNPVPSVVWERTRNLPGREFEVVWNVKPDLLPPHSGLLIKRGAYEPPPMYVVLEQPNQRQTGPKKQGEMPAADR